MASKLQVSFINLLHHFLCLNFENILGFGHFFILISYTYEVLIRVVIRENDIIEYNHIIESNHMCLYQSPDTPLIKSVGAPELILSMYTCLG
jgi:hypothetical protein